MVGGSVGVVDRDPVVVIEAEQGGGEELHLLGLDVGRQSVEVPPVKRRVHEATA